MMIRPDRFGQFNWLWRQGQRQGHLMVELVPQVIRIALGVDLNEILNETVVSM